MKKKFNLDYVTTKYKIIMKILYERICISNKSRRTGKTENKFTFFILINYYSLNEIADLCKSDSVL